MEVLKNLEITLAGVNILFSSEMDFDICQLRELFRHHLGVNTDADSSCHRVEIQTVTECALPDDARQVWSGYYHGVGHDGKHDNTVKKYVAADNSRDYYVTDSGECIMNEFATGRTVCYMISRRKMFQKKGVRANIGSIIILLIHIVMSYNKRYTLHASAVEWRGKAVVFVGRSGQGKSTLSTDLAAKGVGFMGDDIVFLYLKEGVPYIAPLLFDAKLFEDGKETKSFVDILQRYNLKDTGNLPLQAFVDISQTRTGLSSIVPKDDADALFSAVLQATNNLAMQYDRNDWLTLYATLFNSYKLYTCCFGDRALLDPKILDAVYE